jgi:hypothetical protein
MAELASFEHHANSTFGLKGQVKTYLPSAAPRLGAALVSGVGTIPGDDLEASHSAQASHQDPSRLVLQPCQISTDSVMPE